MSRFNRLKKSPQVLLGTELNDVSGGGLAEIIIAIAIGMSGPNVGTIERQAKVLGMSHLL